MKAWKISALYVAKILLFSIIYYGTFVMNPDSFRISSSLNISPIGTARALWERGDDGFLANQNKWDLYDSTEQYDELSQIIEKDIEARRILKELSLKTTAAQIRYDNAQKALQQSRSSQISAYHAEYVTKLEERNKMIKGVMDEADVFSETLHDEITENLNKIIDAHNYIIDNYGEFGLDAHKEEVKTSYNKLRDLEAAASDAETDVNKIRGEYYDLFVSGRERKISRTNLVDFIYFSACISTTTTFGDIIPNSKLYDLRSLCN